MVVQYWIKKKCYKLLTGQVQNYFLNEEKRLQLNNFKGELNKVYSILVLSLGIISGYLVKLLCQNYYMSYRS